jgi:chromate reductase
MDGDGKLRILTISGSLRKKSYNTAALEALHELAPQDFEIVFHDLRGLPMFDQDEYEATGLPPGAVALVEAVQRADGIVIASPEFNHSVSGSLKNAIDWLSRVKPVPLVDKPVAIVSAATSPNGGIRGQYALRLILQPLEAQVLLMPEVFIGGAKNKVDADGRLVDEATRTALTAQMVAFRRWIRRLQAAVAPA